MQGVGAALLSPAALALLDSTCAQGPARNRALAVWGGTAGSGAAGVLLGGVLTSALGWEWVLLVNVPIVVVAVLAAPALLAEGRDEGLLRSFDLPGALLVTTGLVALVYAVVSIESAGPRSAQTLLVLAVGAVSLAAFVAVERRAAAPLMPLGVFRERNLTGANLVFLLHPAGPTAVLFLGSIHLQDVLGYGALENGLAFLPFAVLAAGGAAIAGRLLRRVRPERLATAGMLSMAAGLAWLSQLSETSTFWAGVLAVLATLASSHTSDRLASGALEQAATADGIARAFGAGAVVLAVGAALVPVLLRRGGRRGGRGTGAAGSATADPPVEVVR